MVVSKDIDGVQGWKQLIHHACLSGENELEILMPDLSLGK